jgi:transcriptional regulator with XRE-family HTH domain
MTVLGEIVRENRKRLGLTGRALSDKLGVDFTYISKIENDVCIPSDRILYDLALLFELNPNKLFVAAGKYDTLLERAIIKNPWVVGLVDELGRHTLRGKCVTDMFDVILWHIMMEEQLGGRNESSS